MGFFDYLGKKKKEFGDTVSSLGATAKGYLQSLQNTPAPKVLQNTIGRLPAASQTFKPAYDMLSNINTRPLSSRATSPVGKFVAGVAETPYTFLTSVPKAYGQTMKEIDDKSIFTPGGVKRTAGRALEAGLDTASMGLLGTGKNLVKQGVKSVAESAILREAPKVSGLIREGAKQGMKTGGLYGAGYGTAEALKEEKGLGETVKDAATGAATGSLVGGGVGGSLPALGAVAKAVKHDLSSKKAPTDFVPNRTVHRENTLYPAEKNSGLRTFTPEKISGQTFADAPLLGKTLRQVGEALPRPGASIEDVSGKPPLVPSNANTRAINAVNEKKNATAKEAVSRMMQETSAKKAPVASKTTKPTPKPVPVPNATGRNGNGMESDASSAFAKELDSIPTPWDDPMHNVQKDLKKMGAKKLQETADDFFGEPAKGYNKYQQDAYRKKGERVRAIGDVMYAPAELRAMGFTKKEAQKLGAKEAGIVSKLGKLGYPKDHPAVKDPYSEQTQKIINLGVPYTRLKEYYDKKHALDTHILDGIDPSTLKDISPLQAGTRDVYRNVETVFGGKYKNPAFQRVKSELLDPFDASKGAFIDEQNAILGDLKENIVKKLGITKGSKLSAAVQLYGEGKMPLEDLKAKFPHDWEKVVEADKWFRNKYDSMLEELNRVREYYNPTHPLYPESTKVIPKRKDYYRHFKEISDGFAGLKNIFDTPANIDPSLAVSSEHTKPMNKFLTFALRRKGDQTTNDAVGGFLDYAKAHSYAKHIDPHIRRFRGVNTETKGLFPKDDRIGLAEELSNKTDPMNTIAETGDVRAIKNLLIEKGLSDRDAVRMAKDLVDKNTLQDVRDYLTPRLSEEGLSRFTPEAKAENSQNNLNSFLKFLDNFANDLAGKTNPLDRPIQDNFLGRQTFRALNWVNSRTKANVIVGNIGSALVQFFGIPNGIADAGVKNSTKAIGDSLAGILDKHAPSSQSSFLKERYFNAYDSFDTGILNNTKKAAVWLTAIGDKIGTTFTWNAEYRKALENGLSGENAVKYADDWTRRMVAGRGIGEVPIMQKSKMIQLVAPFQLEVANQWRVFADWARNDPQKLALAKKLLVYSVATWIMNRVAKNIRGNDVAFDPIQAMADAYQSYQQEDDKVKGTLLAGGRLAGEVLSNMPVGSVPASWYPEYGSKDVLGTGIDIPTREQLFGDKDPTRFGGGILASKALSDPLYMLLPPFGGRQIKQTIEGAKTLSKGYAENASGKVMTPVDTGPANVARGLLFGKNAIGEVRDYYDTNQTPLSDQQTELFKRSGGTDYFDAVMKRREAEAAQNKIRDAKRAEVKKMMEEKGNEQPSPEFGAPEQKNKTVSALPGISSALAASNDIAEKVASEPMMPLSDGSYYVESAGKYGEFYDTEEEARYGLAKSLLEKSRDTDFVDMGDYVLKKTKTGPNVGVSTLDPEAGKIEIAKSALEKSGEKFLDMGDTVLVKGSKGVQSMPKDDFTITLNDKRMNLSKDRKDFATWMKAADESAQILQKKLESGDLNALEQIETEDKLGTLMRDAEKYLSYGGSFTKPKAEKKLPEAMRYPLVDKDMLAISRILRTGGISKKPSLSKRPLSLIPARLSSVRRKSRRRILH